MGRPDLVVNGGVHSGVVRCDRCGRAQEGGQPAGVLLLLDRLTHGILR